MKHGSQQKPVSEAIYGYAGCFLLNGRNVLIVTDALDVREAEVILKDVVGYDIVCKGLRKVTVLRGVRKEVSPNCVRRFLDEGRVLKHVEKLP